MSILGRFFKSDDIISTKNSAIIDAFKILQTSSLSYNERVSALTKLKSIFLASNDKNDLKAIAQSILRTITNDESAKLRESAINTFDTIIEMSSPLKVGVVAEYSMPILIEIAKHEKEDATELRRMTFWTLSKIAPLSINDEHLDFLAHSLSDKTDNIRMAAICTFENLVKSSDDALKRRIARFSLSALCEALNDPTIWVRAARAIGGMGKYAIAAAPFLYRRLDDENGEWAANALRSITGKQYSKDEKQEWEKWLQNNVVK